MKGAWSVCEQVLLNFGIDIFERKITTDHADRHDILGTVVFRVSPLSITLPNVLLDPKWFYFFNFGRNAVSGISASNFTSLMSTIMSPCPGEFVTVLKGSIRPSTGL